MAKCAPYPFFQEISDLTIDHCFLLEHRNFITYLKAAFPRKWNLAQTLKVSVVFNVLLFTYFDYGMVRLPGYLICLFIHLFPHTPLAELKMVAVTVRGNCPVLLQTKAISMSAVENAYINNAHADII